MLSRTPSFDLVSKEIIIDKSTIINVIEKDNKPSISIETEKGPEIFYGSLDDIIKCLCELIGCKNKVLSINNFEILSVLRKNFYGKVLIVRKKESNEIYAMQTIKKRKLNFFYRENSLDVEQRITLIQNNPFSIKLYFAFQDQEIYYLIFEYPEGGELLTYLKKLSKINIDDIRLYIAEILLALEHFHKNDYVYTVLNPTNIFLDSSGHIKITSFNSLKSSLYSIGFGKNSENIFYYLAPEVIERYTCDYKADLWSLGIILYEILSGGKVPFFSDNKEKIIKIILNEEPKFPESIHPQAIRLIKKLLNKNPNDRPTFEELKNDPFFRCLDWDGVLAKKIKPKQLDKKCFEPPFDLITLDDLNDDNAYAFIDEPLSSFKFSFGCFE